MYKALIGKASVKMSLHFRWHTLCVRGNQILKFNYIYSYVRSKH
jgi:hypothetical protein